MGWALTEDLVTNEEKLREFPNKEGRRDADIYSEGLI